MNIDFDRICKLAGVSGGNSKRMLREGKENDDHKNEMYEKMHGDMDEEMHEGMEEDMEEGMEEDDQDEMVEVDVSELMSEIRRAKRIMSESKVRAQRAEHRRRKIQENKLKRTIAREVENVLAEMEEHDSSWLYGNNRPRYSKKGYTNQGRTIPGIGFRNRKY